VIWIQVTKHPSIREWVSNCIEDKDGDNQQRKDIVGEASGISDEAGKVKESSECGVDADPYTDPSIEGKERDVETLGHVVHDSSHDKNGASRPDYNRRHAAEERERNTAVENKRINRQQKEERKEQHIARRNEDTHTQLVARIVSTAPIWFSVLRPYTAPKVSVGAMTEINMRSETAIVFWLKFVISLTQWVPTVDLTSRMNPLPHD